MFLQILTPSLLVVLSGHKPSSVPLVSRPETGPSPPIQQLVAGTHHGEGGLVGTHPTEVCRQPIGEVGKERGTTCDIDILKREKEESLGL